MVGTATSRELQIGCLEQSGGDTCAGAPSGSPEAGLPVLGSLPPGQRWRGVLASCRLEGVAAAWLRLWLVSFVFVVVGAVAVLVPVRLYSMS